MRRLLVLLSVLIFMSPILSMTGCDNKDAADPAGENNVSVEEPQEDEIDYSEPAPVPEGTPPY